MRECPPLLRPRLRGSFNQISLLIERRWNSPQGVNSILVTVSSIQVTLLFNLLVTLPSILVMQSLILVIYHLFE